ncbi:unnamed protein product [Heligmosomoides polygyrus]|uniref:Uncharacterized protein n=1 Tax=Heligmosomoides polygyrus TaxID=6339 RepID=A0A183G4K9_HELPZ|nr:unnamed protein product [Heligmosomoides polygyrus]
MAGLGLRNHFLPLYLHTHLHDNNGAAALGAQSVDQQQARRLVEFAARSRAEATTNSSLLMCCRTVRKVAPPPIPAS